MPSLYERLHGHPPTTSAAGGSAQPEPVGKQDGSRRPRDIPEWVRRMHEGKLPAKNLERAA